MNKELIDLHFRALPYAWTACNLIILALTVIGFYRTTFRAAYACGFLSSALILVSQILDLLGLYQRAFGVTVFPKPFSLYLAIFAVFTTWLSFPINLLAVILFLRHAIQLKKTRNA